MTPYELQRQASYDTLLPDGDVKGAEWDARQEHRRKRLAEATDTVGSVAAPALASATEVGSTALSAARSVNFIGQAATTVSDYWDDPADFFGMETKDEQYMANKAQYREMLLKDMPVSVWSDIMDENNLESAMLERQRVLDEQADLQQVGRAGALGTVLQLTAGLVDVDSVVALATGGLSATAKLAKVVNNANRSRASIMGTSALSGGGALALMEAGNQGMKMQQDWFAVPAAGVLGMAAGAAVGYGKATAMSNKYDELVLGLAEEVEEARTGGSVGAAEYSDYRPEVTEDLLNASDEEILLKAQDRASLLDLNSQKAENWENVSKLWNKLPEGRRKQLQRLKDGFNKYTKADELFTSDFDRMMASDSQIAKMLAYDLYESASGSVRNNRTAAMLQDKYEKAILSDSVQAYNNVFDGWADSKGLNVRDKYIGERFQSEFGREVTLEMGHRRLNNGASRADVDPHVKEAADHIQAASDRSLGFAKGRDNELSVKGMEDVDGVGYTPLTWMAGSFNRAVRAGTKRSDIEELFAKGYESALPWVSGADRMIFAKAMVSRQLAKADGIDDSMVNLLTADGRKRMVEHLKQSGMADAEAERLIKVLDPIAADKGKAGFAKHRTEIDVSVEHNGLKMTDFLDTNVTRVWSRYARQMSGRAAMARKGITSNDMRARIKEAILAEQKATESAANAKRAANGEEPVHSTTDIDGDFIDHMFTYFDGGPIGKGLNDNVRRAKQATNLVILNQLGLTQMAETGAIIAAAGIDSFIASSGIMQSVLGRAGPTRSRILDEFGWMGNRVGHEHEQIRIDLALDDAAIDAGTKSEYLSKIDKFLGKAQQLQGYTSGFYHVRAAQQKMAVVSMSNTVARMVTGRGTKVISDARIRDMGFEPRVWDQIKEKINTHAEFTPDGHLDAMNFKDWGSEDLIEEWQLAMNRHTNQVVQKAMAGESSAWMHRDVGALLGHLKTFPLLAIQKQTIRNMRLMDTANTMTFAYGLATAGMAYSVKQLINGREDNLTASKIAVGAFNLSNMTGFVPMLADPVASMFGMDDLRFNRYGQHADMLSMPAMDTLNRVAQAPGQLIEGDVGRAAQAAPIVGNAVGFKYIFDKLKEDYRDSD